MQFIPILLALDVMVAGGLTSGADPIAGSTVTFSNEGATMSVTTDANGRYSLNLLSAGTYDVKIERTHNGRKKWTVYRGLRVGENNPAIDLSWPSIENAEARTNHVRQCFDAGRTAFAANRFSDAITHYMDAIREDSSQHAVWSALSMAQASGGNFDAAEKSAATAIAWGAGSATVSNLAHAYHRAGRYDQAGAKYEAAAAMEPAKSHMYFANAGAAYFAGRNNAKAEAAYKAAAATSGSAATSWYFWGVCAQANNNRADALTGLRGYLSAEPNGRYAADARQRIASLGG